MSDQDPRRLCSEQPNSEILPEGCAGLPPPLYEIDFGDEFQHKFTLLNLFLRFWTSPGRWRIWDKIPAAWGFSLELGALGALFQEQGDLIPDSETAVHDVFLVSRPHWMWPTSTNHWSLYCQGRFYHLTAPGLAKNPVKLTTLSGLDSMKVRVQLKLEDFSSTETEDARLPERAHVALIAYQVGKTAYPPDAIEALARYIVNDLHTYDFFEVNCHHFVLHLMYRTVMTMRDYSVFLGTAPQIANWDLNGRDSNHHLFDRDHGFLLRAPVLSRSKSTRLKWPFLEPTARKATHIRRLYDHGKMSLGAFDPEGKRNIFRYRAGVYAHDFFENSVALKRAAKEFCQDFCNGKWRDAFVGRHETLLENYAAMQDRAQNGDALAKRMLPFSRWVLSKSRPSPV